MKLLRIFFILVCVAIIGVFFAWKKAPSLIASNLSKKMQVEVKIAAIDLSMNDVKVEKIEIGNPKGSKLPQAFSAGSIQVSAPILNYLKDAIVIDAIEINKIYLGLEFTSPTATSGNWTTIMDNMKKSSPPAPKETKEKTKGKSVLIKKLILTDINADLVYVLTGGLVKKLDTIPRLEFTNISSESGISLDQIVGLVLEQTLHSVLKIASPQNILEKAVETPKGIFDTLTAPFTK